MNQFEADMYTKCLEVSQALVSRSTLQLFFHHKHPLLLIGHHQGGGQEEAEPLSVEAEPEEKRRLLEKEVRQPQLIKSNT